MKYIKKLIKSLTIRRRANERGLQIINGRHPSLWSKSDNRNLIRLNRICEGYKPFQWDGEPRMVGKKVSVFECKTALSNYGNIKEKANLTDSVEDLMIFNVLRTNTLREGGRVTGYPLFK